MIRKADVLLVLLFTVATVTVAEAQVEASFTADTNRVKSYSVLFTAQDTVEGYRYIWDFGDGTADTASVSEHYYPGEGTYRVVLTVTDPVSHQSDTAQQLITVRDLLQIPNVFTPNNDSRNDFFIIRSNGKDIFTLTVFTRAGVKVCEISGQTIVWDGRTPAGRLVTSGVYYYLLKSDRGINRAGFVHVIY
jgi:gliding motility-associated-like protein